MTSVRRLLGIVATLWLCGQAVAMTSAAALVGMVPFVDAALLCTCSHAAGDSAMCPMHHAMVPLPASPAHAGHQHMGHMSHGMPASHGTAASEGPSSRGTPASRGASTRMCHMRSADAGSGAMLVSVFGPLGLLAPSTFSVAPAIANRHGGGLDADPSDYTLPPDLPPPRA